MKYNSKIQQRLRTLSAHSQKLHELTVDLPPSRSDAQLHILNAFGILEYEALWRWAAQSQSQARPLHRATIGL